MGRFGIFHFEMSVSNTTFAQVRFYCLDSLKHLGSQKKGLLTLLIEITNISWYCRLLTVLGLTTIIQTDTFRH